MVSKSFFAYAFLLCFTTSVNAHCLIQPALGVKGNGARSDVQTPSTANPCGNVNIAQTLDTSTAVPANTNGSFSPSASDFNAGADGSRSIKTVQIDASGTGQNFVPATMLVNGNPNPTSVGTDPLTVQMPAGTKCTGGTSKNLCLASFVTTAGFGNCVVVSQGPQGSNNDTTPPTSNNSGGNGTKGKPQDNTAGNKTETATGDKNDQKCHSAGSKATNATRRTASFKRKWSSRESVKLS